MRFGNVAVTALAVLSVGTFAGSASALTVLSNTDFEAMSLGSVNTQEGWSATGAFLDQEVVDDGTGNQVLRLSNQGTSGTFGDQVFAPKPGTFAGESSTVGEYGSVPFNKINASFSFKSASASPQAGARITISTDDGNGGRQSFAALRDCGTAEICVDTFSVDGTTGEFVGPTQIGGPLSGDVYHTLEFDLTFVEGPDNDLLNILIDSVIVATLGSWEQFYALDPNNEGQDVLHPGGVANQTLLFRMSGTAVDGVAGFFIDNVLITADGPASAAPEPATVALLGLGALGLAAARRRQRTR
jgi:PEP-CTERM motif-containing protein